MGKKTETEYFNAHEVEAVVRIFTPAPVLIHTKTIMSVIHPVEVGEMLSLAEASIREAILSAVMSEDVEFKSMKICDKNYFQIDGGYYEQVTNTD